MFLRSMFALVVGGLLLSACASTGGVNRPSPFPEPAGRPVLVPEGLPAHVTVFSPASFLDAAQKLTGVPYRLGGDTPSTGFDCSGYIHYVFGLFRIPTPRTVAELFQSGAPSRVIKPGDLLFFKTNGPKKPVSHVALALNDHEFIHAPSDSGVVRTERLDSPYWKSRFAGARRLL